MNIIIAGSGKVGFTLAEQLVKENHDVTIMDTLEDALRRAADALDVMAVRGNGVSSSALLEHTLYARSGSAIMRPTLIRGSREE